MVYGRQERYRLSIYPWIFVRKAERDGIAVPLQTALKTISRRVPLKHAKRAQLPTGAGLVLYG